MNLFLIPLLLLIAFPAFAAGTQYFSAMPDLPLPAGLSEDTNSAVRFDQPEGRVIVLEASGTAQAYDITKFYQATLPALGWKSVGQNRFIRDEETMTIDIKSLGGAHNRLNILLKPQE